MATENTDKRKIVQILNLEPGVVSDLKRFAPDHGIRPNTSSVLRWAAAMWRQHLIAKGSNAADK